MADATALLDKVMRGEVPMLAPPGTLAAAVLVPCFAIGAAALAQAVAMTLWPDGPTLYVGGAAAILLVAVAILGHALVLRGRPAARLWLRTYARVLLGVALANSGAAALAHLDTPWPLVAVATAGLAACEIILRSRGYLAFSSFFSLKRRYRENQAAASDHVLGRQREGR